MQIEVPQAVLQTEAFACLFLLVLIFGLTKKATNFTFGQSVTNEVKGFAILFIIFAHIGYFLSKDTHFLFPLSTLAGVGVNLFLFLSGYGLTLSQISRPLTKINFYRRRMKRLYVPLWITLIILTSLDWLILKRTYSLSLNLQHFAGLFSNDDIFSEIDSPLWYFTLILFYYLVFPLTFIKKINYFSPSIMIALSYVIFSLNLPYFSNAVELYKLHSLAFPLGVIIALTIRDFPKLYLIISQFLKKSPLIYRALLILLIGFISFTALNSGVGHGYMIEQSVSLLTTGGIILVFIFKKVEFNLFKIFGRYSYEIYLFHWPLLFRYDLIYKFLPAFLATFCYLPVLLIMGKLIQDLTEKIATAAIFGKKS